MTLTVIPNLIQGSDPWLAARRGIITASVVGQLISTRKLSAIDFACPDCGAEQFGLCRSKNKAGAVIKSFHQARVDYARDQDMSQIDVADNDTSRGLTAQLAAERITGWTDPTFISDAMLRGLDDEPLARLKYDEHYAPVTEVGLMIEDRWGYKIGFSPDGLVGDDGLIEIKSRAAKIHIQHVLADEVPAENMAQLQCGLLVSGRQWIDYVSYSGGLPMWVKRVEPDPKWFQSITAAVEQFEKNAAAMITAFNAVTTGLPKTERTNREVELKL